MPLEFESCRGVQQLVSSSAARRTTLMRCLMPLFLVSFSLSFFFSLSLFVAAFALLSSSPFTVVYAVVSACCFHVCFFARVSFLTPSLSSLSFFLSFACLSLLVTSSCASYSRQVCFICITNQPRASENLRKATYFTFLYHLLPLLSPYHLSLAPSSHM